MVAKRKTTATPSASIVEPAQKRSRTSSGLAEAVPSNARCRPNFKKEPGSLYSLLKPTKFTKLGSVDVQEPSRVGHGLGSAQQPLDGSDEAFEELNPGIPFRVTYHSLDWRTKDFTVCVASSLADALRDSIRDATSSHGSAQAVESITRYPILISLDTVGAYSFRSELILHLNEDPWKDLSRRVQQEMAANKALEIKSCTSVLGLTTCVRTAVMILQGDASLMAVMRSSGGLWSTITELSAKSSDAERWSSWTPQQVSGFRDQFYAARGEQRRQADAEKTARKFYSAETRNRRRGRITRVIKNATAAQYARARELLRRPLDGAEIQPIRHSYRNLSCPLPDHVLELAVFKLDSDHEALDANHALAMTTHSLMIWCRQLVQRSVLSLGHFNDVLDLILITQDSDKSSCEAETVNVQVKLGDDTATSFFERLEAGIDSLVGQHSSKAQIENVLSLNLNACGRSQRHCRRR